MKTIASITTAVAAVLAALAFALPAQAAFPGANGRIGYAVEEYPTLSDAASYYWIASILPDGSRPRSLGGNAYGPVAFSPNGRRIAYTDGYSYALWTAPVTGRGRARRISAAGLAPDWSPSARRIVYVRAEYAPDFDPADELWIYYFNGERRLTEGTDPTWSVKGDIAFVRASGISVIRPNGSGLRQITARGSSPDWSPDGSRIVFELRGRIATIRADGSRLRRLSAGTQPSFSPDGKQIVFLRGSAVFKMTSSGRSVERLRSYVDNDEFGFRVFAPDWQPRPPAGRG